MPNCIITGEIIHGGNNSRAHVIPSALGGRLKPLNILSKVGNSVLGDKVDLPLIEAFQSFMTLLNGSRDRGKNQPVSMTDPKGRRYIVEFNEPIKLAEPTFSKVQNGNQTEFRIEARTLKEAKTILGRVKKDYPEFDVDHALKHAITKRYWPTSKLRADFQIGPVSVFPALFGSASIFASLHGLDPHPSLRSYVTELDPSQPKLPPDTFYFMPAHCWISTSAEVSHIIALLPNKERGEALLYFELFNIARVGVLLPYHGDKDIPITYAVDLLTGQELNAAIDTEFISDVRWAETHKLGDDSLYLDVKQRVERLAKHAYTRAHEAFKETLGERLCEVGKRPGGGVVCFEALEELVDFTIAQWKSPHITPTMMLENLHLFEMLCRDVLPLFPKDEKPMFSTIYKAYYSSLSAAIAEAKNLRPQD